MLVPAAALASEVILGVHIVGVVLAFGVVFAYPVITLSMRDPRVMPVYYRMRTLLGRRLISPGLVVVLAAGIYLSAHGHDWKHFYVQWGIVVVIVIGAVVGAVLTPREKRLVELAQRDVAAAGGGEVTWSAEYQALSGRVLLIDLGLLALVTATIFLMAVHAG